MSQTEATAAKSERAAKMLAFIDEQLAAGRVCYLATPLRITKITAKHRPLVRIHNGALEIQNGKRWLDYTFTTLRAA